MNRSMNRVFKSVAAASCLFAGLASAALSAQAADEPASAKSQAADQDTADREVADEAPQAREDQDKAKQRKTEAKAAAKSAKKKPADKKTAAQDAKKSGAKAAKKAAQKSNSSTESQEPAALALVKANHPELLELLEKLKADNPRQYEQAILELYRASKTLSDRKAKDPARYELDLKAWKLDSQARLLAARLTMDADAELEAQLKAVLAEREDVAIAILAMDRQRLADRLKQIEGQLEKRREQRDARANRAFERLTRRSGKPRAKNEAAKDAQAATSPEKREPAAPAQANGAANRAGQEGAGDASASKPAPGAKP